MVLQQRDHQKLRRNCVGFEELLCQELRTAAGSRGWRVSSALVLSRQDKKGREW